jgi:hypothetical protein
MKPPPRLLDDASTSAQLRVDLAHATSAVEPYDLARGLAALEATLDGAAQPEHHGDAATDVVSGVRATTRAGADLSRATALRGAFTTLKTFKAGLLLLAGASAVGVVIGMERSAPDAPAAVEAAQHSSEAVVPVATPPGAVESTASAATQPSVYEAPAAASSANVDSASRREIAQLLRIKHLLPRAPAAAYRLAQASQREFPNGALREEREGLAVLALWLLEAREPAQRSTREFLERYPQSPLRERLQRLLASSLGR